MSSFLGFCEGDTRNRWRDGQVCPDVDKELWRLGQTTRCVFGVLCANKKKEVKRDFGDLRIRRSEGRVVNTPLVFKRVLFEERKKEEETRKERSGRKRTREFGRENGRKEEERRKREGRRKESERESGRERGKPALNGEKGLTPEIGVKKTMNAGGVENGTTN
ncbi:hypothetical protein TNCV_1602931 [Trichonephila clavipes]|nr:hypothetical protein TNCV_1602931 [Trichonephila clavipes]